MDNADGGPPLRLRQRVGRVSARYPTAVTQQPQLKLQHNNQDKKRKRRVAAAAHWDEAQKGAVFAAVALPSKNGMQGYGQVRQLLDQCLPLFYSSFSLFLSLSGRVGPGESLGARKTLV
eukprot:6203143-Pleurochrysis_carterae.AAC.1